MLPLSIPTSYFPIRLPATGAHGGLIHPIELYVI
jgi:hypothetical protein